MGGRLVRVGVMSESRIVREGLKSLIAGLGNRTILVEADLPPEGRDQVDVIIYDIGASARVSGHAELRRLAGLDVPVVALVRDAVPHAGWRPNGAGPGIDAQFISLDVTAAELLAVLERVVPAGSRPRPPAGLTNRELTVIALIGAGLSNKEIAERLFLSGNTVKTHVRTGYSKIGVRSRIHAAMWAMEHGLVAQPVREHPMDDVLVPSRRAPVARRNCQA